MENEKDIVNYPDLIALIAKEGKLTKRDTKKFLNAYRNVIKQCLKDGKYVKYTGFGTYESKFLKEIMGRNPLTGEEVLIPSRRKIKFKFSKMLKNEIQVPVEEN